MIRRNLPTYWQHPSLNLHRQWFTRRAIQNKTRAVLIGVALLLLVVWALGASPLWLLLALLGVFMPTAKPEKTLQEIENTAGAAYTTALTAKPDEHGFQNRLLNMALATQKNTELPALPWLEGLSMALLLSLLLVLPPRAVNAAFSPTDRTVTRESFDNPNSPSSANGQASEPILDAPTRDAPPAGADAKLGQAASGGSASEQNLGALKPGGGNATEDPEAISKEFLEALERGAVRDRDPNKSGESGGKVEDANPPSAGNSGSADGKNGDGKNETGQGQQGNKNGQQGNQSGQNGQQGNQNGQNGQQGSQNGQGQNGKNGAQGGQNGQGQNGQNGANQAGNGTEGGQRGRNPQDKIDKGEDYQGFDPQNPNGNGSRNTSPGQGARDAQGNPVAANRQSSKGKLEYLQGTPKGNNVRSGALQLPGDPRNGFTSPTSSATYRRAAESAVLDPRLPPEYQEMLKNYYK
jgi:hypothetical protein